MSPVGSESFLRLDEFSSFISCIKCFGKPIIPPLVSPSHRNELKELQIAAVRKETEKLIRKKELFKQRQDINITSKTYGDCSTGFESSLPVQESCALWCPSSKDCQGKNSVAISKLPTSGIYSSVHTGAIVCSNVIENDLHTAASTRDSLLSSEANPISCVECSHNDIDPECSLCQEEYNESIHNKSFTTEVPCRTSLQQQDVCIVNEELNCAVEETDCESLPTVICNKNCAPFDTDSESYMTCISQSTDLDKYMEFSHELSSPDNSFLAWDSKSASQPFTSLSRSDDASSETIVNTENELTPCTSTLAELTDNIEDELSNADETAGVSDREVTLGRLQRSRSMDSCMKLIQNCTKIMNVKKSLSEPLNAGLKTLPDAAEVKIPSLKTSFLIKEDSKESEESKDIQEKDIGDDNISSKNDKNSDTHIMNNSFEKKHIRQNSYTLDEPSTALILAHADCTCEMDADLSPHSSALPKENGVVFNSAFWVEKVEVGNTVSYPQMKMIPILSPANLCESIVPNKENMSQAVIDVFPVVKEDSCEKSNSENSQVSDVLPTSTSVSERNNLYIDEEHLREIFSKTYNISEKSKENLHLIYQDLQKTHEIQLRELHEQQNQLWLKIQEGFKEKERILCEKIKLTLLGSPPSDIEENDQINNENFSKSENTIENASACEKDLPIPNSTIPSNQIPTYTSDNFTIQNFKSPVPIQCSELVYSQSKNHPLPQNSRASVSPSRMCKNPDITPSKPFENIQGKQLDESSSSVCNLKRNEDYSKSSGSKQLQNINGFASVSNLHHSSISSQLQNAVTVSSNKKCDNIHTCVCDKSVKQFQGCTSLNGCWECNISNSDPEYISTFQEQNYNINSGNDFLNSQTSLLTSCVQSKDLISGNDANNHKNVLPISYQKSNDCNLTSLAFNNKELPCVDYDRNVLPQAFLKQNDLSVISPGEVSLAMKMLKNGSVTQHVPPNKRSMNYPVLLKKFEKLPAFVKGYLTRRLFKSERVRLHYENFKDTGILIKKLEDDLVKKKDSISEEDLNLRRQLYVQLCETFSEIHRILSESSVKERMCIIAESRNIRLGKKNLNQVQDSSSPVIAKAPESAPSKKHNMTPATESYLDYKRNNKDTTGITSKLQRRSKSTLPMHIYNIDGKDQFQERARTSMSSKSLPGFPSSVYNNSIASRKGRIARRNSNRKTSIIKGTGAPPLGGL